MFAEKMKEIRKKKGLGQKELAQKAEMSRQGVYQLETGKREPTLMSAVKIAKALEVDINELIKEKEAG